MFSKFIIFFAFLLILDQQINCSVEVETELGKIIGFNDKFEDHTLDVFYGVRYGVPPVGKLRFKNSSLIEKFEPNPYYAVNFTSHCPIMNEKVLEGTPIKEDCLFLNIWRPSEQSDGGQQTLHRSSDELTKISPISSTKAKDDKCKKRYPVIMYFYGGVGSIFMKEHHKQKFIAYDGAPMAALGQMIVVTVNYRSSPFGNLYVPGEIEPNAGFFDQALSIEWIHKHIGSFCGDSNRITIYGNSLGSISVGFNLLSSYSNRYFSQAIMQSASPLFSQFSPDTPDEAYEKSVQFAENVNCVKTRFYKKKIDVECLQKVPLEEAQKYMFGFYNFPTFSGEFFSRKSKMLYKVSDVLNIPKDKKILIGLTSNEICLGGLEFLLTKPVEDGEPPEVSEREARKAILTRLALIREFKTQEMFEIADFYTQKERNYRFPYYDALDAITSDLFFNCPVSFFGQAAAERLPDNVYSFVISKKPKPTTSMLYQNLISPAFVTPMSYHLFLANLSKTKNSSMILIVNFQESLLKLWPNLCTPEIHRNYPTANYGLLVTLKKRN